MTPRIHAPGANGDARLRQPANPAKRAACLQHMPTVDFQCGVVLRIQSAPLHGGDKRAITIFDLFTPACHFCGLRVDATLIQRLRHMHDVGGFR